MLKYKTSSTQFVAKFSCRLYNQYSKTDSNLFFAEVGWCPNFFHTYVVWHTPHTSAVFSHSTENPLKFDECYFT